MPNWCGNLLTVTGPRADTESPESGARLDRAD